jgi:hypothetical protein
VSLPEPAHIICIGKFGIGRTLDPSVQQQQQQQQQQQLAILLLLLSRLDLPSFSLPLLAAVVDGSYYLSMLASGGGSA